MTESEIKREKAKRLRFKKPISKSLNLYQMQEEMWEMRERCSDIHYYAEEDELLYDAFDGDEDEVRAFKMSFADLDADLDRFKEELEEAYVTDYFDLLFPAIGADYEDGYLGYDTYEGDYFGLEPYEYAFAESEAQKKLLRLSKKELLEIVGACLKIAHQYMAIRYRYDCLDAAIETLRGLNLDKIKAVKGVEEWYDKAEEATRHFQFEFGKEYCEYLKQIEDIPQEFWVA